jgi:hypothetical protein
MVMINLNDYATVGAKYMDIIGHSSDHENLTANSHSENMNDEFDEVLPCTCDECVKEFLTGMDPVFDDVDESEDAEYFLAEDLEEAVGAVIENLVFLGDGTTTRDVMKAILELEATLAIVKLHLLESEE